MTEQRIVILEELQKCFHHPGADEMYIRVRKRLPRISLGTVYRNLERMSREGVIQKLEMGGDHMRFDPNPRDHNHFKCTQCGAVEDINFSFDESFLNIDASWKKERRIEGCVVILHGLCAECALKLKEKSPNKREQTGSVSADSNGV